MQILLPADIEPRLTSALAEAGLREIGGILMGESLGRDVFRIKDLTIQRQGGTVASFVRALGQILAPLARFFRDTGRDYTRYNYLGEWHSHPSFATTPSARDASSMWEIVEDAAVGANFAVLLIVRLDEGGQLQGTPTVYLPGRRSFRAELRRERGDHGEEATG